MTDQAAMESGHMRHTLERQFAIGLLVHLLYVAVMLCANYDSLHIGGVDPARNHWWADDRAGYIRTARTFLDSGAFVRMGAPDYHRTVGYPLFLATMMSAGGAHWAVVTYLVQAVLLATVYPAITVIATILFPSRRIAWPVFVFSLVSGCYFPYAAQMLTDGLFAACFVVGVCFGLLAVVRRNWWWLLAQCAAIGFAAQVRPSLITYPIVNAVLLAYVARRDKEGRRDAGAWKFVLVSTVMLTLLCNLPSIRNYVNYRVFLPTDILSNNCATYLAKQVLANQGGSAEYERMDAQFHELYLQGRLKERLKLQDRFAWNVFRAHPVVTAAIYSYNAFWNLFEMHWQNVFYFYRLCWLSDDACGRFHRSPAVFLLAMPWVVVYSGMYLLFGRFLIGLLRRKEWLGCAAFVLFVSPLLATFVAGEGARMRLPVEGLIVVCAAVELHELISVYRAGKAALASSGAA